MRVKIDNIEIEIKDGSMSLDQVTNLVMNLIAAYGKFCMSAREAQEGAPVREQVSVLRDLLYRQFAATFVAGATGDCAAVLCAQVLLTNLRANNEALDERNISLLERISTLEAQLKEKKRPSARFRKPATPAKKPSALRGRVS